jgi:tetratricopeptide (TPR) repeat protein
LFNIKVIIAVSVLLIGGCAGTLPKEGAKGAPDANVAAIDAAKIKGSPVDKEVKTQIDPDVLYMLVTAEIAGQREQYDVALEGYLEAARRVNNSRVAERAAKIALFLKDTAKTQEAVSLWLKEEPDNLVARKIAILSALRQGKMPESVESLNFLAEKDPAGFEATLLELVKALGKEGKGKFLMEVFDQVSDANSDTASIFFAKAFLAMHLKQNTLAQENIDQALELQPEWTKALLIKVQLAVLAKDDDKAKAILLQAMDNEPNNERLNNMLAKLYIKTTEYEEAASTYVDLLEINPKNTEAQFSLALVYLQLKQDDDAKALFGKLVEHPRWQAQSSLYMGRIEAKQKQVEKALTWFDRVTSGPLVLEAGISSVSLLMREKRYDEAAARLSSLKDKHPKQELRLVLLQAELYNKQKQYQQAFDVLTKALLEKPEQKDLLYTRALIAERLNMVDVAEGDLKYILEKYPDDANTLNALGYTLIDRTDRYDEAAVYLQKAIELKPNEPVIQDSYGWLMFKQGKLEEAVEYLSKAYEVFQGEEIAVHLIQVYWKIGEEGKAKDLFEKVFEESPDNEYILEVQKLIPELLN